jgi:hypothetical protein
MLKDTSKEGTPEGCDIFLPCVILAFMQIRDNNIIGRLKSIISYVRLFRHESLLEGEEDYYLTTMENVVQFLHDLKPSDLKLEEGEQITESQNGAEEQNYL